MGRLRRDIARRSNERARTWWERYLKGTARFHGTPMEQVRAAVHSWWDREAIGTLPPRRQKELALAMFDTPFSEEKLAGTLMLQEKLLARITRADLPLIARLFDHGLIADWSTCDWFCVKVLGPRIELDLPRRGFADQIAAWRGAKSLWRRRASTVAFVNIARHGDDNFDGFVDLMLETAAVTVQTRERFAQTGVAWMLRELSVAAPREVTEFVELYRDGMTNEARKMALAKLSGAKTARG